MFLVNLAWSIIITFVFALIALLTYMLIDSWYEYKAMFYRLLIFIVGCILLWSILFFNKNVN